LVEPVVFHPDPEAANEIDVGFDAEIKIHPLYSERRIVNEHFACEGYIAFAFWIETDVMAFDPFDIDKRIFQDEFVKTFVLIVNGAGKAFVQDDNEIAVHVGVQVQLFDELLNFRPFKKLNLPIAGYIFTIGLRLFPVIDITYILLE
jgi:hypothetical protein